jgi:hypothetical protein
MPTTIIYFGPVKPLIFTDISPRQIGFLLLDAETLKPGLSLNDLTNR